MQKISIYDMDRTITVRGTYTPFLFHMVFARAPWRLIFLPLLPLGFVGYALKLLSRSALKEYNQRLLLGSKPALASLQPHIESYANKVLSQNSYAPALAQIEKDRAEGRRLVMATASYELYVREIGARLGFDDIIGTILAIDSEQRVRPNIIGENCYDAAKLDRIKSWMKSNDLSREDTHIRAYSDHASDAPMLQFAHEAIATTPSAPLRALAQRRGWKILDWSRGNDLV